ncbi:class I adenylate-forming enzyme family protein [Nocardioides sp. LHG3406-4]|uniref:class I adenylate-forming enzyme family protein n=1 Tax=Nocardioides sp. LHG3406-4 TaxID=2804575 RepID=UPI003CEA2AB1
MSARDQVDDFAPPWAGFADFFLDRTGAADRVFLVELDHLAGTRREWTAGEWRDSVLATAGWLSSCGVREGETVATLAGNTAGALRVAYAAWVMGACCVPLNPGDDVQRQSFIIKDSQARLLVHSAAALDHAGALAEATAVPLRSTDDLPQPETEPGPVHVAAPAGAGLDVPALRVYTSGTTGQPKGVVLTARNLLTDCDALHRRLGWSDDTRVLTVLPVHHVNGLVISSLLPWYAGLTTVLCDRFRSERFWEDVEAEGATVSSMVPSLLEFLLSAGGTAPEDFAEVLCGAGPLLVDTVMEFEERFGVPVRHLYGLSETTAVVTLTDRMDDDARRHWHRAYGAPSIGPALAHVEVEVHDLDGSPVGEGERGELVMRGAVVMEGYAGLPDATAEAFRGGWFRSGDEGFWIRDGEQPPYFFITGRIKELIIRGGTNISPLEIDAVLRSHPAVDFALAVPFENRYYGEEVAAYVVASAPVSDEEILAHCARYLDHARTPKVVIQGDDVPFTVTGKAKRLELKQRLAPQLAAYREQQFRRSRSGVQAHHVPPLGVRDRDKHDDGEADSRSITTETEETTERTQP